MAATIAAAAATTVQLKPSCRRLARRRTFLLQASGLHRCSCKGISSARQRERLVGRCVGGSEGVKGEPSERHWRWDASKVLTRVIVATLVVLSSGDVCVQAVEEISPRRDGSAVDCVVGWEEEEEVEEVGGMGTAPVSNESVVQEAWQVVNDVFFDARHGWWSQEAWARKKEEVLKRAIGSRTAAYGSIRSMLRSLDDPYTRFLTPQQFALLAKYDVTGIGLNLGEVEEGGRSLKVVGIVLGSPAEAAGVKQGDELLSVNGTSVAGASAFEASSLIQASKGGTVSIQIRHRPCAQAQVVTVARQQQAVRTPVLYRLQSSKETGELVGYIQLKEFNALAKRDVVTAMKRLQQAGAAAFLLDLQDNLGGLVQAGIEIAKLFLDSGDTVVETVGRNASSHRTITASAPPLTRAPLTVLVNERTASASEIVSAALHDNCRAVLVGRHTFGKGLIQSIYELSDGSGLVLTVGKYVTPGHTDIDRRGIEPDFNKIPGPDAARLKLSSCQALLDKP